MKETAADKADNMLVLAHQLSLAACQIVTGAKQGEETAGYLRQC